MTQYRAQHEAFTSNRSTECHAYHVLAVICHAPLLLAASAWCHRRFKVQQTIFMDFLILCVPMVLVLTIAADYAHWTIMLLTTIVCFCFFNAKINPVITNEPKITSIIQPISQLKGINMLITCIAILAVDFKVFPRYFAKTETFGFSLMDIGIAMFIISSALTSKYARGITESSRSTYSYIFKRGVILLLGIGRLITLKLINYQEHNTEYGVHWNFFVTIFFIWIITDVINTLFSRTIIAILCVVVLVSYQFTLCGPLTEYVFYSDRNTFLGANREGVCSLPAGIVLYLLTEMFSYFLCYYKDRGIFTSKAAASGVIGLVMWCLWYASDGYIQPTSRRLMNVPYVCLSLSIAFVVLAVLFGMESFFDPRNSILEYLNKYQLQFFLVANLFTGLINLTIPTMHISLWCGLCIIILYVWMLVLGVLAVSYVEGVYGKRNKNEELL